jgi:hypothetical protein
MWPYFNVPLEGHIREVLLYIIVWLQGTSLLYCSYIYIYMPCMIFLLSDQQTGALYDVFIKRLHLIMNFYTKNNKLWIALSFFFWVCLFFCHKILSKAYSPLNEVFWAIINLVPWWAELRQSCTLLIFCQKAWVRCVHPMLVWTHSFCDRIW